MITIDGSLGEGGGQILRTSLSLSMCLTIPVKINNIRAGRKKPGLLRQHLTCVRAAQEICQAEVEGAELGSSCIEFRPDKIKAGTYTFAIGTAGSTGLVFQTILPALLQAEGSSDVYFEGGTHNQQAPSFDFIARCFLPALLSVGVQVEAELHRYGFYPKGGGRWKAVIKPNLALKPMNLLSRGELVSKQAVATSSNLPENIVERELHCVREQCGWQSNELVKNIVRANGPGNILSLQLMYEHISEVFDSTGVKGLTANRVAGHAITAMNHYLTADVPVGEYLCDQLLLPLALGQGGKFRTSKPSSHTLTNIEVVRQLTGRETSITNIKRDVYEISVGVESKA